MPYLRVVIIPGKLDLVVDVNGYQLIGISSIAWKHVLYPVVDFFEDRLQLQDANIDRLERVVSWLQADHFSIDKSNPLHPLFYIKKEDCGSWVITEVKDATTIFVDHEYPEYPDNWEYPN